MLKQESVEVQADVEELRKHNPSHSISAQHSLTADVYIYIFIFLRIH